jgi:putative FmdB family regulatory protein
MPLYEYECSACGHQYEVIRKFSDPPEQTCPKCGGAVHKLQSAPAFQFKGTGWYVTDYAKSGKTEGKSDTKESGKTESKADGGSKKDSAASTTTSESTSAQSGTSGTSGTTQTKASPKSSD